MAGLVDIAPVTGSVSIRGTDVDLVGFTAEGLAVLLGRFPELRALFAERELDLEIGDVLKLGADIVAAALAAGTGAAGDPKAEAAARALPLGDQAKLLHAMWTVSFAEGTGPLVDLVALVRAARGGDGEA